MIEHWLPSTDVWTRKREIGSCWEAACAQVVVVVDEMMQKWRKQNRMHWSSEQIKEQEEQEQSSQEPS